MEVVVGITQVRDGIFAGWDTHAFIMYIDPSDSSRNIMLDASGHYGVTSGLGGRSTATDVVTPDQAEISVDAYVKYWSSPGKNEELKTYELHMSPEAEEAIRTAIENTDGRSSFNCAGRASELLANSGLFEGLHESLFPETLEDYFDDYEPSEGTEMSTSEYSLDGAGYYEDNPYY